MASKDKIGFEGLDQMPRPPRYSAMTLKFDGTVIKTEPISVQSDDEALDRARALVDGHAVELWDGMRFIEHFPPKD